MNRKVQQTDLNVVTNFAEQDILIPKIEKLAEFSFDRRYSSYKIQPGFRLIETCSIEVYIKVDIDLNKNKEVIYLNTVSNFMFTCIKAENENYKLQWSISLS